MNHVAVEAPGPRAHLAGTRRLLGALAALATSAGHDPVDPSLRGLLGPPAGLPERVPPEGATLKYDAYLSEGPAGLAWGLTLTDRWEEEAFRARVRAWIAARLPGAPLERALALGAALARGEAGGAVAPAWTLALGYDAPGQPPRGKLYFQEPTWGGGVATAGGLRAALAAHAPGCELPAWIAADRPIGVVTAELLADGRLGVKVYLGGPTAAAAAEGAPAVARALGEALVAASPLPGGWGYLTVRLRPDEPVRYSANRIYDHVAAAFTRDGAGGAAAWADVRALFAHAGRGRLFAALDDVRAGLPGTRIVPTASALDDTGAADVYCAAWALDDHDEGPGDRLAWPGATAPGARPEAASAPAPATLRTRREGVERGRWWGEELPPGEPPERRFHLVAVGLPKTGTTTLAGLFRPFRWGYEFLFGETVAAILDWEAGRLPADALRAFLDARARAGGLELDAASFNHLALPVLLDLHPDARFVYTRRDAAGWVDSFLNMLLRNGARLGARPWPGWQVALGRRMAPSFDPAAFLSPDALAPHLDRLVPELLAHHVFATAALEARLPPERTLVLETAELSRSLDRLATWAGVPTAALDARRHHENVGEGKQALVAAAPAARALFPGLVGAPR